MYETSTWRRQSPAAYKNHRFTTVSDVRPARSDERVARRAQKFAFHHSFGRPTSTKWREGRASAQRICISPQFWASDEHEMTRGLLRRREKFAFHHSFGRPTSTKWREGCFGELKNLHFTTVLGVRRARSDEKVVSRRDLPNLPCGKEKKKEILKRSSIFKEQRSQQLFSAALLSSLSQQLFSAALLRSSSQQPFSAALLSSSSQQPFSAALLTSNIIFSSSSQQPFSAAFLSSSSQQPFSAALLSSSSQQLFSAALLSSSSQQLFSAFILLWSGVGGQVCYRSLEGPFRNAFGKKERYHEPTKTWKVSNKKSASKSHWSLCWSVQGSGHRLESPVTRSESTMIFLGQILLFILRNLLSLTTYPGPPIVLSLGIWPSGWIPCSKQKSSQQALPIWTPGSQYWSAPHETCTKKARRNSQNLHFCTSYKVG